MIKTIEPNVNNEIPEKREEKTDYLAGIILYQIKDRGYREIIEDKEELDLAVQETTETVLGYRNREIEKEVKTKIKGEC